MGGRIAHYLDQRGYQITLGTRQTKTKTPSWLPRATVLTIDWDDKNALIQACHNKEYIIHAAGMNAKDSEAKPEAAFKFNGNITDRFIKIAAEQGVSGFIFLSTAHVYSSHLEGQINEESRTTNTHPYARSNLTGEESVISIDNERELQGVVLRLSNAFGAPMHKHADCWMLIANDLCRQAVTEKVLTLYSDGSQLRDYISIDAVCNSIYEIIKNDLSTMTKKVFNIGSGITMSALEMAKLIQDRSSLILGYKPELIVKSKTNIDEVKGFSYRSKNMDKIGIEIVSDPITEIDSLLRFCNENFST